MNLLFILATLSILVIVFYLCSKSKNSEHFGFIASEIKKKMSSIAKGPINALKDSILVPINLIKNLVNNVKDKIFNIVNQVKELPGKIINGLKSIIDKLKNSVIGAFKKIWDGIKGAFTKIWDGIKNIFKKISDILKKMKNSIGNAFISLYKKIKKFFSIFWERIRNAFTKVWDIITDPLSFFMNIFGKITVKMTSGVNKTFQSSIWSFFPPAWQGTLNKYGTYVLLGTIVLCIFGFIGINALINIVKTDGLCVDPKNGNIIKNQFNEAIKDNGPNCPYHIPKGMCENPNTKRIYTNDAGQQLTSDNPDCPGYIPTQPEVIENVVQVETPEETSYTDFRNKLQKQIGGRRKRRRRRF